MAVLCKARSRDIKPQWLRLGTNEYVAALVSICLVQMYVQNYVIYDRRVKKFGLPNYSFSSIFLVYAVIIIKSSISYHTYDYFVQTYGDGVMLSLHGVTYTDAGVYRCIGNDILGRTSYDDFNLEVLTGTDFIFYLFELFISEDLLRGHANVPIDTCTHTSAYPLIMFQCKSKNNIFLYDYIQLKIHFLLI